MLPWSSQMSTETQPGRYRLVAVDLDGSVQPNGTLHQADAAALRAAHAAGVKVVRRTCSGVDRGSTLTLLAGAEAVP